MIVNDPMHMRPLNPGSLVANLFGSLAFRALFVLSFLTALVVGPITYWTFDNVKPFVYHGDESGVIPPDAEGNDQMIVMWKVHFNRACPGFVRRQLFDPHTGVILATYDPIPVSTKKPGFRDGYINRTFLLPRNIQTGWIGYRSSLEFWCNPLQRFWPLRYDTPELYFMVHDHGAGP